METYGTYFHGISKTTDSWNTITSSCPYKYDLRFLYGYSSYFTFPDRPGRRACDKTYHARKTRLKIKCNALIIDIYIMQHYLRESKIREALMRGRGNGEDRFFETEINEVILLLNRKNGHDGRPVKLVVVVVPILIRSGE